MDETDWGISFWEPAVLKANYEHELPTFEKNPKTVEWGAENVVHTLTKSLVWDDLEKFVRFNDPDAGHVEGYLVYLNFSSGLEITIGVSPSISAGYCSYYKVGKDTEIEVNR